MKCQAQDCDEKVTDIQIGFKRRTLLRSFIYNPGQIIDFDAEDGLPDIKYLCLFHNNPRQYHKLTLDILRGV